jgi:glycosyltransferase involved in cell wall biosynthesis
LHHKESEIEEPIKIGFAASVDRTIDIDDLLKGVLPRLKERYKDGIRIQFFGAKPSLVDRLELEHFPYVGSYEEYQNRMKELDWDIGLAPMPDTDFHKCKHYNKFIEYGAFSIVGVYSDVKPYNRVVQNGENGILCGNSPDEWFEAVCSLIGDKESLMRIRNNLNHQMRMQFGIERVAQDYLKTVPELTQYGKASKKGFWVVHMKVMDFIFHCLNYLGRFRKRMRGING